jgi:hypothetical protein
MSVAADLRWVFLAWSLRSRPVLTDISIPQIWGLLRMRRGVVDRRLPAFVEGLPITEAALA